jgi:hypothetical protein
VKRLSARRRFRLVTVFVASRAGAVRLTPIGNEPKERTEAIALTATVPTWGATWDFCAEHDVFVSDRDGVFAAEVQPEILGEAHHDV